MSVFVVAFLLISIFITIDNFRVKRKITRLNGRVERLSENLNVKCNMPQDELSDEFKLVYLENQIEDLETSFQNHNCQEELQKDTQLT